MDIEFLVRNCYKNKYDINLKKHHLERSSFSSGGDLNFSPIKIVFSDESGKEFNLIKYSDKFFLTNGISCYPCGRIVNGSQGKNWLDVIIIPNGQSIVCETSIWESSVVFIDQSILFIRELKSSSLFLDYLSDYEKSFKGNSWYGNRNISFLIKVNGNISFTEKYRILKKKKLLNPIELCITSIYYGEEISYNEMYESLINKNDLSYGITFVTSPRFKPKLAKSTKQIFINNEVCDFLSSFSNDDVYEFFEINFINTSLDFKKITEIELGMILNIGDYDNLLSNDKKYSLEIYKKNSLNNIGLTSIVIQEFYERIRYKQSY